MFKNKKFLFYLLIVAALIIVGFLRDFVFVNLNYQAKKTYYHLQDDYELPNIISFIKSWSYTKMYYTKWLLTIVFSSIYASITLLCINLIFHSKTYTRIVLIIYGILLSISFLAFIAGYLFGDALMGYTISRQLMGIVQSPLVLMIVLPALFLNKNKVEVSN